MGRRSHSATVRDITSPAYVFILQDREIFENDPVELTVLGNDRCAALLPLRINMPAGTYAGKIVVLVCYDPACASHFGVNP